MIKKIVDTEAKASLQPSFRTKKIESKYLKDYRPSVKKDKDDINWEH